MEHVTVVTTASVAASQYLRAARDSVQALELPAGVSLEWIVVIDAEDPFARKTLTSYTDGADLVLVNPKLLGPGASRNRALAHATGSWVVTLDADDVLCPDAAHTWADTWNRHGRVWQAHRVTDFGPDAEPGVFPSPWPEGAVSAGSWLDQLERDGKDPLHPMSVLYPYEDLVKVGGWGTSPLAEDAAPVLAVTSSSDGAHSHRITHRYRKHPDQTTARVDLTSLGVEARRLARTRAHLLHH